MLFFKATSRTHSLIILSVSNRLQALTCFLYLFHSIYHIPTYVNTTAIFPAGVYSIYGQGQYLIFLKSKQWNSWMNKWKNIIDLVASRFLEGCEHRTASFSEELWVWRKIYGTLTEEAQAWEEHRWERPLVAGSRAINRGDNSYRVPAAHQTKCQHFITFNRKRNRLGEGNK